MTEDKEVYDDDVLSKHLQRQVKVLKAAIGEDSPHSCADVGSFLEKDIFCPSERPTDTSPDPKLNFYPPFLVPECLAMHFPFFLCTAIPLSCKANRANTDTYQQFEALSEIDSSPPSFETTWNEDLGNVDTIEDLKENQKLALLKNDSSRVAWFKTKSRHCQAYAFPAISLPPSVQKTLVSNFIGKPQDPNNIDSEYEPAYTKEDLEKISEKDIEKLAASVTFGCLLTTMFRFFTHPQTIKNMQESLHYTFSHGFVRLIHLVTDTSLSEFVTYHGLTHKNRLNNPLQHLQLTGQDLHDYLLDTIYLYIVFTWQTAMDIWGQCIDEKTISCMNEILQSKKHSLLNLPYQDVCEELSESIFPPHTLNSILPSIPDFVNQTQMNNFRLFINSKSNIPQAICPCLPSDFIPLKYEESRPILWPHVFSVRFASFLLNHGNYAAAPTEASLSQSLCECNLCSPHRMPCYNSPLLNELLSVGSFQVQNAEGKQFALTPQKFATEYLKKFYPSDFFPHKVKHYHLNKSDFSQPMSACVLNNEKLLALARESQERREKTILKRGSGIYLDPKTGEKLSAQAEITEDDGELQTSSTIREKPEHALLPILGGREQTTPEQPVLEPRRGSAQRGRRKPKRRTERLSSPNTA